MSAPLAGRRGLRGFRLNEVPEPVRLRALDKLLMTPGSEHLIQSTSLIERAALGIAAVEPSDRVYWVSREAWERVVNPPRRVYVRRKR